MRIYLGLALLLVPSLGFCDYKVFYDPSTGEIQETATQEITVLGRKDRSSSDNADSLSMMTVPNNHPVIAEGSKFYKVNDGVLERKSDGEIQTQKDAENKKAALEQAINLKKRKQALDELASEGMDVSVEQTEVQVKLDSVIASPALKVK